MQSIRTYHLGDEELIQRTDLLIISLNNDIAVLGEFGVTAPRITALQALRNTFSNVGQDETFMYQMVQKRQLRDDKKDELYAEMSKLLIKVRDKWDNDAYIGEFGLNGSISQFNSPDLLRRAKVTKVAVNKYLAQLATYNINAAWVTNFSALITDLDTLITDHDTAQITRSNKTGERILAGNSLYAEVIKLAKIGQDYWHPISPEKEAEYVINNTTYTPVQNVNQTVNAGQTVEITGLTGIAADASMLFDGITSISPEVIILWYGDDPNAAVPPQHIEVPGGSPVQNHIAGDLGYDPVLNNRLFARNQGTQAGSVHIRVNG